MKGNKQRSDKRKPSDNDRLIMAIDRAGDRIIDKLDEVVQAIRTPKTPSLSRTTIHVVGVELKRKENEPMPPVDHMPPLQLPASTVRAKLSVVNPRKPDGSRVDSVTWTSSDETQLPLEAIADSTVMGADPNWVDPGDGSSAPIIELLDPADSLPLKVFSTYANTPLDEGQGTVTVRSASMADADILIKYSDPPVGHFAIVAVEAAEE